MTGIEINGEEIPEDEAVELIRMLYKDSEQIAGEFHNMERSTKFRLNWPNEYDFAKANWKNFVECCRAMYAERLADPKTLPEDARKMHLALVLQAKMAKGQETDNRLQLHKNSQQFAGDKFENKKILEKFGTRRNFRAAAMGGAAKMHGVH